MKPNKGLTMKGSVLIEYTGEEKEVTVPEEVTHIAACAFSDCKRLEAVTLPDSLTEIGLCACEGCSRLREILLPDGVSKIGFDAFKNCSSLQTVSLPDGINENAMALAESDFLAYAKKGLLRA